MPGFLYFVPGVQTPGEALKELARCGAPHAVEMVGRSGPGTTHVSPGPGDESGYLVGHVTPLAYQKGSNEWRKAPVLVEGYEGRGYWIGWQKDHPPGPEDLARGSQLRGHFVELGDGNRWLVPAARRYDTEDGKLGYQITLPSVRRLTADGHWRCDAVEQSCRRLWELVCLLDRYIAGDEEAKDRFDLDAETELVVEALHLNYRVGAAELSLRDLLVTKSVTAVIDAVTDKPALKLLVGELEKKAPPSGEESTSPGEEG